MTINDSVKSDVTFSFIMKYFIIGNQKFNIVLYDKLYDEDGDPIYGQFRYDDGEIRLNIRKIENDEFCGEEQLRNTLWHEIFHAFSQMYDNSVDEKQAQCYANFMRELESSKQ